MAKALMAGFDYWGDTPREFFVPVVPVADDGAWAGRGVTNGFVIFSGASVDLRGLVRTFTHEHQHSWISRQIGGFPDAEPDLEAWLNEGFDEALTGRVLLRAGLWTLEDFVEDLNKTLTAYGTSPVRDAANQRIQSARSSDFDVGKLPYDRGRLVALLLDHKLRTETAGRVGLGDVLQAQRKAASINAARGRREAADTLFPKVVRQVANIDIAPQISAFVDRGEHVELPTDLFGDCAMIETINQPIIDRGFDLDATQRNHGKIVGLAPGGPADRAGLHEGQRIHIDEMPSHDSQTPLTYPADQPDGSRKTITYKPEGQTSVSLQRLHLSPGLDASGRERCQLRLSGATGWRPLCRSRLVPGSRRGEAAARQLSSAPYRPACS